MSILLLWSNYDTFKNKQIDGMCKQCVCNGSVCQCAFKNWFVLKVCLEHSFHLLVNGQFEDAKLQLSIAESWRYGKQSAGQSQRIRLIQAYSGFLDYFIWCDKKATASSTGKRTPGNPQVSIFHWFQWHWDSGNPYVMSPSTGQIM